MTVEPNIVLQLDQAILGRAHPAVTRWNRLEGRPRTHHFASALRAEVRDGLWMLSRQWQLGEFVGDDAGSPLLARGMLDVRPVDRFQPRSHPPEAVSRVDPLEARVERRALPLTSGTQYLSLDIRLAVGRRWRRLLTADPSVAGLIDDYVTRWKIAPPDPDADADAAICAHVDVWQRVACAAERGIDGIAFLQHFRSGGAADEGIPATAAQALTLTALARRLRAWFEQLIETPTDRDDAWDPTRLEYAFAISARTGETDPSGTAVEIVMEAPDYHHGTLDWFAVDARTDVSHLADGRATAPVVPPDVQTFIPTNVVFDGMPSTRWWAFEDRRTNFGEVRPDKVDLGTMLMMEFALVFANDWFVVPWTLPIGSIAEMRGIAVTNVFGERTWVTPFDDDSAEADRTRWSLFQPSVAGDGPEPPPRMLLLPVAPKVQEGEVLEQVALVRDEQTNMVWAIEQTVPLASGDGRPGRELASEFHAHLRRLFDAGAPAAPPPYAAPVRYRAMTDVPEHWIPMVPVHVPGNVRETQLQRAAMPRMFPGSETPEKVRPRTPLLQHNLPAAYFLHEEEVPRAGVVVDQCYQRTRHPDGAVHLWYGSRKSTGRGEASSGLRVDALVPRDVV